MDLRRSDLREQMETARVAITQTGLAENFGGKHEFMLSRKVAQRQIQQITAVSVLALLSGSCASYAGDRRAETETYDYHPTDYYSESRRSDERVDGYEIRQTGIEGARDAHRRYSGYRAEQLDGNCESRVRINAGESLSDLAEFCDVSVASIIDSNPGVRNPNYVSAGELFYIPSEHSDIYRDSNGRRGDAGHGYQAASEAGHGRRNSPRNRDYYVVRSGDSLADIAERYNVSLSDLVRLNNGVRSRDLNIGDRIYLPDAARSDYGSRRDISFGRPAISFSPRNGSRDADIRVIGERFESGEQVAVLYGVSPDRLVRLRSIPADDRGRIDHVLRLPQAYEGAEAYFAMQRGDDTYVTDTAYTIDQGGVPRSISASPFGGGAQSPSAVLRAMDREVYRDDTVTLSAEGFPSNTPVSIYGGPNRDSLTKILEIRTGPSGLFQTEVRIPDNFDGDSVLFVAAVEDGARTYFTERVRVRGRDSDQYDNRHESSASTIYPNDQSASSFNDHTSTTLTRGLDRQKSVGPGFLSKFRLGETANPVGINVGGPSAISGVLTNEGRSCPSLRDDAGNLFTLLGDLRGFSDGDRVLIRGSAAADDRICNQAKTIQIFAIQSAPW